MDSKGLVHLIDNEAPPPPLFPTHTLLLACAARHGSVAEFLTSPSTTSRRPSMVFTAAARTILCNPGAFVWQHGEAQEVVEEAHGAQKGTSLALAISIANGAGLTHS